MLLPFETHQCFKQARVVGGFRHQQLHIGCKLFFRFPDGVSQVPVVLFDSVHSWCVPISLYWTLFTYLAQLIAGTSSIDRSCSDLDPISPSSIGVHCCFPGGRGLRALWAVRLPERVYRPLLVSPFFVVESLRVGLGFCFAGF